jgi:hypothetical protein
MAQSWFVSRGEKVYGPWSTEEVTRHRRAGNVGDADVIWGEGQSTWVALARWSPRSVAVTKAHAVHAVTQEPAPVAASAMETKPVAALPQSQSPIIARAVAAKAAAAETFIRNQAAEALTVRRASDSTIETGAAYLGDETVVRAAAEPDTEDVTVVREISRPAAELWHYAVDGASFGPFSRPALVIELRRQANPENVSLWTKGMREWAALPEFHDLMNELGVNRRSNPRASIGGTVTIAYDDLKESAPLVSISEGGIRVLCDSQFIAGQILALEIVGEGLSKTVAARAEVRYSADGILGLKFEELDGSARSVIAAYVNRHAASEPAAA